MTGLPALDDVLLTALLAVGVAWTVFLVALLNSLRRPRRA